MTTWANTETGELQEGDCPNCAATREECEAQLAAMERERRSDRIARAKAERAVEHQIVAKRDGTDWARVRDHWLDAFPELKPTSLSIKGNRATQVFLRIDKGCTIEHVLLAIDAAKVWRYVVYGKRTKSGSRSDLAIDLEQIVSVKNDHLFDFLVAEGYALRPAA